MSGTSVSHLPELRFVLGRIENTTVGWVNSLLMYKERGGTFISYIGIQYMWPCLLPSLAFILALNVGDASLSLKGKIPFRNERAMPYIHSRIAINNLACL